MRQHGTRACYVFGLQEGRGQGCRCEPCRRANADYVNHVTRQQAYGRWRPWASEQRLEAVRQHLRNLATVGVGKYAVADAAGVSRSQIYRLRRGEIRKIREDTACRILSVTTSARRGHAIVDGTETWRLVDELIASGMRKYQIAFALGAKTPALQLRRDRVLARHERAMKALHDARWPASPELRAVCRCYAATAVNHGGGAA